MVRDVKVITGRVALVKSLATGKCGLAPVRDLEKCYVLYGDSR